MPVRVVVAPQRRDTTAAMNRTSSFDGATTSNPAHAALKRPASSDNIRRDGDEETVYEPSEHKKEVRLGLRHRDSFAVHRAHVKGGAAPTALLTAADLEDDEESDSGRGGRKAGSPARGGAGAAASPSMSDDEGDEEAFAASDSDLEGGSGGGSDSDGKKGRNPFRSMAKGVGSFLGLRKSKKKRAEEEAARAAADAATEAARSVGGRRGSITNYPGQCNQRQVAAVIPPPLPSPRGSGSSVGSTGSTGVPLSTVPPGALLASTGGSGRSLGPLPLPPKAHGAAGGAGRAPPPPGPPPAGRPAAAAAAAAAGSSADRSAPPPPPGNPAAVRQAAACAVPPSPPPRPPGMPASAGGGSPVGTPGGSALRDSVPGRAADPINNNHRSPSSAPGILRTAPTSGRRMRESEGGESARSAGTASSGKRRLTFADHHGGKLENVRFCADLHYSENSDHSESEGWEEAAAAEGDDKNNCIIM